MNLLISRFNPSSVEKLMCRYALSVDWEGVLYDCDFNIAANLYYGREKTTVESIDIASLKGTPIKMGAHCYA